MKVPYLIVGVIFILFVSSAQAVVWLYPTGATIYVNSVTYTTSHPINFTYIEIGPTYATFNFVNFTVSSINPVTIEIEEVANSTAEKIKPLVKFNATTTSPSVTFQLKGFASGGDYELHVDDAFYSYLEASVGGVLSFTYNHFSKHSFAIFGLRNYTFQVRYENFSQGLVNLSRWGPHEFIVQYDTGREENWFADRVFTHNETNFSMYDFYNGSFNISIDKIPLWFELHWNDTAADMPAGGIPLIENFVGYDERIQNKTNTYITLQHIPSSYSTINVTCINMTSAVHSYPVFGWSSDMVTIYAYTAKGFSRVIVNYSYTYDTGFRCNRIQVADSSNRNVTFYIYTNKKVYGESSSYFNNSLIRYTYDFEDKIGTFSNQPDLDTYAYVYTYTPNGTRMIIHSEYWDTTQKIYPWLLYEKEYFIGVSCSDLTIDRVGVAPTSTNLNPVVIISPTEQQYYSVGDIINIRQGWMAPPSGCYVYYEDTVGGMNRVDFYLYNFSNLSLAHQDFSINLFNNFTYPTACQHMSYYWIMIINHSYWNTNQTISGVILYLNASIDASYINRIMNMTLGKTPFRNVDTGQEIPWVYIIIFAVFFILLVSFSIINAYGAVFVSGLWLLASSLFFHNLPMVGLLGSAMLATAGCFLMIIGVLAALGGFGKR